MPAIATRMDLVCSQLEGRCVSTETTTANDSLGDFPFLFGSSHASRTDLSLYPYEDSSPRLCSSPVRCHGLRTQSLGARIGSEPGVLRSFQFRDRSSRRRTRLGEQQHVQTARRHLDERPTLVNLGRRRNLYPCPEPPTPIRLRLMWRHKARSERLIFLSSLRRS